jgi:hypothetical protein
MKRVESRKKSETASLKKFLLTKYSAQLVASHSNAVCGNQAR